MKKKKKATVCIPPEVTQASVCSDFLQPLEILSKLVVQDVGQHLSKLAIFHVFLSVEEPVGDLVLSWVWHHCDNSLNLQMNENKH